MLACYQHTIVVMLLVSWISLSGRKEYPDKWFFRFERKSTFRNVWKSFWKREDDIQFLNQFVGSSIENIPDDFSYQVIEFLRVILIPKNYH